MRISFQSILTLAVTLALGAALIGCNTMRGFGRDVERGGERVQDAATNAQNRM